MEGLASWRDNRVWEGLGVRFRTALNERGIEPRYYDFYRQWIWEFLKTLKPGLFQQNLEVDVREFLSVLHENGKPVLQVRQEAFVHLSTMSSRKLFHASRPARFLLSPKSLSFERMEKPSNGRKLMS